jgi:hypothetical protein
MRAPRMLNSVANWLVLVAVVLGASLTAGCKSYHYYDIDVKFMSGFTLENAGMIQICTLNVSGADHGAFAFPDNDSTKGPVCPIQSNWPDLGTFEYSTFEDSGTLNFLVSAYNMTAPVPANCFAAGSLSVDATSAITTSDTLTLSMTTSGCAQ